MQRINNIEIKNFKSIRHAEIKDCRKINVFVGPPNVGKSNVLEGMGLYGVEADIDLSGLIRMDSPNSIFFNGNSDKPIEISLNNNYKLIGEYKNRQLLFLNQYKGQVKNSISSTLEEVFRFEIHNKGIVNHSRNSQTTDYRIAIKKYAFTENPRIGGASYNELIYPNGGNIFKVISSNERLKKYFADMFSIYDLKLVFDKETEVYRLFKFLNDNEVFSVPYSMIADTLRRLFFYITSIISNKNTVLLFEEPEANCYEPYIMEITNAIKNDENNNQFFIVTHSQYVIDELLRDKDNRENVNIYLVGLDDKDETKVKLLKPKVSEEIYKSGLRLFFNFENLWDEN